MFSKVEKEAPPPTVTPEARPSSKRRDEILHVTSRLLRTRGLAVSLQDIASELGITYNALYNHFEGREDLIFQCLLRTTDLLQASLLSAAAGEGSGLDRIFDFLRGFRDVSLREQTPSGVLSVVLSAEAQATLGRHIEPSSKLLGQLISNGIGDGSIEPCDPLITATWILHMLYWWPHEIEAERPAEAIADQIFELIRRALTL